MKKNILAILSLGILTALSGCCGWGCGRPCNGVAEGEVVEVETGPVRRGPVVEGPMTREGVRPRYTGSYYGEEGPKRRTRRSRKEVVEEMVMNEDREMRTSRR